MKKKQKMGDNIYKIVDDKTFERQPKYTKKICNQKISSFQMEEYENIKECIFINCHITLMKIFKIEKVIKLRFINCRISKLIVRKSFLTNMQFIGCEIYNSEFRNSRLPGITFSKKLPNYINIDNDKSEGIEIMESSIINSKFLFCTLNSMRMDNILLSDVAVKHCYLKDLKILNKAEMRNIDFRGTKVLESDFGECKFENVRSKKGFFLIALIEKILGGFLYFFLFIFLLRFINFKRPLQSFKRLIEEKREIKKKNNSIILKLKLSIKKILYKLQLIGFVDMLASTELNNVEYSQTDFSESYHLFWQIQEFEYIDTLKKKHPLLSLIYFVTTNYMRSIGLLILWCLIVILGFSIFYSNWGKFNVDLSYVRTGASQMSQLPKGHELIDNDGRPIKSFYISFKIFMNSGIYPLDGDDTFTEILIMIETFLGYFALGILVGIIVSILSQRTSLPMKKQIYSNKDPFY